MECERFSDSFWRNEEVGEKRVNYYLGLITAVFAGLIALATSDFAVNHMATVTIAAASESGLLAIGIVTHLRMRKRDEQLMLAGIALDAPGRSRSAMRTGVKWAVFEPSPSWPTSFSPQQ